MPNERILILEDHPELLKEISAVLAEAGYVTQSVTGCAEALELIRQSPFDLLLADVFLPDGSGIDTFQQMRQLRPELAGVVITVHSTWELAQDALRAGFVSFLVKPIVPEQLLAAVVSALEQEKLRHENVRLRALVPLYELSRAFMSTVALPDLLHQIVNTVRQETHAQVVSLMMLDDDQRSLRIAAAAGLPSDIVSTQKRMLGNGIAGRVAQTGEPLLIAEGVPIDPAIRKAMTKPEILSALCVPLKLRDRVIGVLNLSRAHGNESFTRADLELATVFAGQAAIAIDKTRLIAGLQQLSDLSQRLARAVDLDDVCQIILNAPIEIVNARGTALRITTPPLERAVGLDGLRLPLVNLATIAESFSVEDAVGWLTLPLRYGDKLLGGLWICLAATTPPIEEQLGSLRTLAHVAGAVIESHRLRLRETQAFREVDRAMRDDLNLSDLLERLLKEIIEVCNAEGGTIFRWNNERTHLSVWMAQGVSVSADTAQAILNGTEPRRRFDAVLNGYWLAAPLAIGNRTEGLIVLMRSHTRGDFRTPHVDLLSTLSSAAALVIRNAQLYARSEEAAIAEERTRIAREIHDGLAQNLSYLVLKIGVAQKLATQGKDRELKKELNAISDQLRRDARDVRRIIFALRPVDIETIGFLAALQKFIKEFGTVHDLEIAFNVVGDCNHLPPKLETALFRLTQEALNNVRKHAQAKQVSIDLQVDQRGATLNVRDDGLGFDLQSALAAARARGSVGIVQMRERAERAGGTFVIETAPGKGTAIQVKLPLREM